MRGRGKGNKVVNLWGCGLGDKGEAMGKESKNKGEGEVKGDLAG